MTKGTGIRQEHAPKPGSNWQVTIWKSGETILLNEGEDGELSASLEEPEAPKLNREERRALKRLERKKAGR